MSNRRHRAWEWSDHTLAEMPEHTATGDGGQIHLGGKTAAVLLVGQNVDRQWETASGQHDHQTLVSERADEAIERHRREMVKHGAQLQTEATVGGQQRITGHCGPHLAVTQDEMRQDRKYCLARRTLDAPDSDPTEPDTDVMRVAEPRD